jgi:hypothetical protein
MLRYAAIPVAVALLFGPPRIEVKQVANPATAPVRGAVLLVTASHHQTNDEGIHVSGRAEGLVAGKRVTRTLTLTQLGSKRDFAVLPQWDRGTPWVLVFTITEDAHDDALAAAEAVLPVNPDGSFGRVTYPMGTQTIGSTRAYPWPRRVTAGEIDSTLRALRR